MKQKNKRLANALGNIVPDTFVRHTIRFVGFIVAMGASVITTKTMAATTCDIMKSFAPNSNKLVCKDIRDLPCMIPFGDLPENINCVGDCSGWSRFCTSTNYSGNVYVRAAQYVNGNIRGACVPGYGLVTNRYYAAQTPDSSINIGTISGYSGYTPLLESCSTGNTFVGYARNQNGATDYVSGFFSDIYPFVYYGSFRFKSTLIDTNVFNYAVNNSCYSVRVGCLSTQRDDDNICCPNTIAITGDINGTIVNSYIEPLTNSGGDYVSPLGCFVGNYDYDVVTDTITPIGNDSKGAFIYTTDLEQQGETTNGWCMPVAFADGVLFPHNTKNP